MIGTIGTVTKSIGGTGGWVGITNAPGPKMTSFILKAPIILGSYLKYNRLFFITVVSAYVGHDEPNIRRSTLYTAR